MTTATTGQSPPLLDSSVSGPPNALIIPRDPTAQQLQAARELLFNNDAKKRRLAKLAKALSYNYDITRGPGEASNGRRRTRKSPERHGARGGKRIKADLGGTEEGGIPTDVYRSDRGSLPPDPDSDYDSTGPSGIEHGRQHTATYSPQDDGMFDYDPWRSDDDEGNVIFDNGDLNDAGAIDDEQTAERRSESSEDTPCETSSRPATSPSSPPSQLTLASFP